MMPRSPAGRWAGPAIAASGLVAAVGLAAPVVAPGVAGAAAHDRWGTHGGSGGDHGPGGDHGRDGDDGPVTTAASGQQVPMLCSVVWNGRPVGRAGHVPLVVDVSAGAPAAVGTGQPLVLHPTVTVQLPWWLAGLGGTGVDVTGASLTVSGTDVHPTTLTAHAALPVTVSGGFFHHTATASFGALTFTAGTPGTAVLRVQGFAVDLTVTHLFWHATVGAMCSADPDDASSVVARVPVAATSTVPVGGEGAAVLAGALGMVGVVVGRRRWRRFVAR